MLLNGGTLFVLLGETCADDDETFCAFLLCEHINCLGAEFGRDTEDGAIDLREVIDFGVALHALHLGLFGVHGIDLSLESAF